MYFNKKKRNIHHNVYLFITCTIYQESMIPSSEQKMLRDLILNSCMSRAVRAGMFELTFHC